MSFHYTSVDQLTLLSLCSCKHEVLVPAILNTHIQDWEISSLQAVLEEEKQLEANPSFGKKRKHMGANEGGAKKGCAENEAAKRLKGAKSEHFN